jgi:hypothetical protein
MARPKESIQDRISKGMIKSTWEEDCLALSKDGASDVELREELNISDDLWYRWIDEDEEFSRTIKRCHRLCQIWWERHGRKMASGQADGNATVWIFNMKNRFGWTDRTQQDNISTDGSISISWED